MNETPRQTEGRPITTGRGALRRIAGATAVAALLTGSAMAFGPAGSAVAAGTGAVENADARRAVAELAGARPWSAPIPADFAASAGYRPTVSQGLLVAPNGDCSAPIPLPDEFETACKAHDLGYDLLRYAARGGHPLGPWARQRIDAALEQHMHSACQGRADSFARAECHVLATVASTAVDLNSRRQDYAAPMPEYLFGTELSGPALGTQLLRVLGPGALALLVLAAVVAFVRRRTAGPHRLS
ncbi:hypothetical protein NDR87_21640 [Nocardia sp. CDC159]|uniref:Phospholipase A2-like protein n=1 Tax=Nocardia pulmonis TaxID=2951408 RepID=A0A9X2EBR8_9NOCA|nr:MULTISPECIES: hypothetical protein [Nocardia]MCM6776550.1 hypothetical protein [Nocardia pulmonis]MCM6788974.1 hypothetical protein [Nocardia sp. CDC159]